MDISLRPADESDLPFLLELRLQTMNEHYVAAGAPCSQEEHLDRVLSRFECASIILIDGAAGGLLKLDRNGKDWHLMQIQLRPELQSRGIGTKLRGEVISQARNAGASVRLGVLRVNPSRRLYERLGFLVVEETSDSVKMCLPSR